MPRYVFLALALTAAARADDAAAPVKPVETATLTITIHNVSDAGGELRVGLYDEAGYKVAGAAPVARKRTRARGGTMTVTIADVPPGTYAVKMYQDINDNGIFDVGARLIEPYGISGDPPPSLALPPFADAAFDVHAGDNAIDVTLH